MPQWKEAKFYVPVTNLHKHKQEDTTKIVESHMKDTNVPVAQTDQNMHNITSSTTQPVVVVEGSSKQANKNVENENNLALVQVSSSNESEFVGDTQIEINSKGYTHDPKEAEDFLKASWDNMADLEDNIIASDEEINEQQGFQLAISRSKKKKLRLIQRGKGQLTKSKVVTTDLSQ